MSKMVYRHTLAVRFFHWWNAISIIMLILTGFYIHTPYGFPIFPSMDVARKIHFIFMYAVIAGLVGRLYYAFISGDYKNFKPRLQDLPNMIKLMKYYLFLTDELPDWGEKYNPGQKMMYAGFVPLLIIQIITGFILYFPTALNHWAYAVGGMHIVRIIHYVVAWIFVYCVAAHIYLDFSEGIENIVGMITGYRPADFHERHAKKGKKGRSVAAEEKSKAV
ncbi:MAG: Ni/Fe-hydrogenase, b-type cytochrome subunit [Thermacetogeniaceae bacterium]